MDNRYYIVVGCDLAGTETEKLSGWLWEDGQQYTDNKRAGEIQIFSEDFNLVLGYILHCGDEYSFPKKEFDMDSFSGIAGKVLDVLDKLAGEGVFDKALVHGRKPKIIVFSERV